MGGEGGRGLFIVHGDGGDAVEEGDREIYTETYGWWGVYCT
jgi:hypothetical protein